MRDDPRYVCRECAIAYGGKWPKDHIATVFNGVCHVCGNEASICHVRSWGYPNFSDGLVTKSCGNIFADLGLPNSEERLRYCILKGLVRKIAIAKEKIEPPRRAAPMVML